MTEILIGEEEKWTNKGNDKQEEADSLSHNTQSHTQHLYQTSKSYCRFSSSSEIFDRKKCLHTNMLTEKMKTITSHAGAIINVQWTLFITTLFTTAKFFIISVK